jgi:phosphopantetheinyl transferase
MMTNQGVTYRYTEKHPYNFLYKIQDSFLHNHEKSYMDSLSECRKHDFLSGRYLLKLTCTEIFKTEPTDISVSYKSNRPYFLLNEEFYNCSIAHSKRWVAVSFSKDVSVGIDVEEVRERTTEFSSFIVTKQESLVISDRVPRESIATICWVIKEATLKGDPEQVSINRYEITDISDRNAVVLNTDSQKVFDIAYFCHDGVAGAHII